MNHKFCSLLLGATMLVSANVFADCYPLDLPGTWTYYMTNYDFNQNLTATFYCKVVVNKDRTVSPSPASSCRFTKTGEIWPEAIGPGLLSVTRGCFVTGTLSKWFVLRAATMSKDKNSIHGVGLHYDEDLQDGTIEWEFQFDAVKK